MKVSFFPKTKLGKWSLIFFLAVVVLIIIFFLMITVFDQRGGDTFFSNLYLTIPMIVAWIAACLSFITGIISIIKSREKSIAVYITTLICILITIYGLLEVTIPH